MDIEKIRQDIISKKKTRTQVAKEFGLSIYEVRNLLEIGKLRRTGKRGRKFGYR